MRFLLPFLVALAAAPAAAQESCDDLWFTRNLIMDRAGYCFGTALGRAVFDNAGCSGSEVRLDAAAHRLVEEIRALEATHQCKVNTAQRRLELGDIEIRRRLVDLPLRDEFASGCMGWREAATPLRAGHSRSAKIIGQIEPGDYVGFAHWPVRNWVYVTVHAQSWGDTSSDGWMENTTDQASCDQWAG